MIDVAFTGRESRRTDVAVVIDVLRATSTATQALADGFREVVCVESVDEATAWRAPGRVLAGERDCVRPPGFDLGNSPRELAGRDGELLVLATTNGAPAIVAAARRASTVLLACLLNLDAVLETLLLLVRPLGENVQIVCSGTGGAVALDDVYVAGRISAALSGSRTDAALVAEAVARGYGSPLSALEASASARALRAAGLDEDIAYCATESTLRVVPRLLARSAGAAIIVDSAEVRPDTSVPAIVDERDTVSS